MDLATITHKVTLSTTDFNLVGDIKVRQADDETQIFDAVILEHGMIKNFEGLKPFFCLMAREVTGQGVSEEPVTEYNGSKGTLKYTVSANAMQMVGRNEAYFSFRKELSNGEWIEQFSTKSFFYTVEKSIYTQPFKDSNYWWTFKELYRKFLDYQDSGKISWEEFVEQNREILESVDPGGVILTELIDARDSADGVTHPNLKARLDNKEQEFNAQLAQTAKVVNAKSQGAKGDGVTDDWAALQDAIVLSETLNRPLYIPEGVYYVSQTLRTRHQVSYNFRPGITIYGAGKDTILLGKNLKRPANYTGGNMSDQAVLALHGSNNTLSNLSIQGGDVGLYLGQDPRTTVGSHVSMNIMEKLWLYDNGTAVLYQHGGGNAYNKTRDVHISQSQIGIHLMPGLFTNSFYNNRNTFDSVRVNRSWIGYLIEDGDGNMFNRVFAEGITPAQAIGDAPAQLPTELNGKACAIVALGGQYNNFTEFAHEAVDWDIYSTGFRFRFTSGMIKDDTSATLKVTFPRANRQPLEYSANSRILHGERYQPDAGIIFDGPGGTAYTRRVFDLGYHPQDVNIVSLSDQITEQTSASRSIFYRLGMVSEWHVKIRFTVNIQNEPIKIKLPLDSFNSLNDFYTRPTTGDFTFSFPVSVGAGSPDMYNFKARFATEAEANAYGGNHIIIPAPSSGWHQSANANYLTFNIRYFSETSLYPGVL